MCLVTNLVSPEYHRLASSFQESLGVVSCVNHRTELVLVLCDLKITCAGGRC